MPPRDYDDRRVEVYFGPSRKVEITKEELAEFIIDEMGLERSDGGPKWTEGVAELVGLGMDAFEEQWGDEPEYGEEINKLNKKLDEYQSEVREIATTQQKPFDTLIQASKLTRRTQARILKILSERVRKDDGMMLWVDQSELAQEADIAYSAVSHHTRLLDQGGFVERGEHLEKVKLSHTNSFKKFCKLRMLDRSRF
jgi:DNA-binding MarR family transcriptional regulator